MTDRNGLKGYALISRSPFPRSYLGKILLAAFVGTHVPLLVLVLYLVFASTSGSGLIIRILIIVLVATIFGFVLTLYVLYQLLKPIELTSRSLRGYLDRSETPDLPTGFTDLAGRLMADVQCTIEQLDKVIRSLEEASIKDYLTNVYNRRYCEERLRADLARIRRTGGTLTFTLMDLDQFKSINDWYGHQGGDACLRHFASIIGRNIREDDWFARWGGDEFALVLWETEQKRSVERVLERITEDLAETPVQLPEGGEVLLTLSSGAYRCTGSDAAQGVEGIFARADEALYRAKEDGKSIFIY